MQLYNIIRYSINTVKSTENNLLLAGYRSFNIIIYKQRMHSEYIKTYIKLNK